MAKLLPLALLAYSLRCNMGLSKGRQAPSIPTVISTGYKISKASTRMYGSFGPTPMYPGSFQANILIRDNAHALWANGVRLRTQLVRLLFLDTHKKPTAKVEINRTFLLRSRNCKLHSDFIGRANTRKSQMQHRTSGRTPYTIHFGPSSRASGPKLA